MFEPLSASYFCMMLYNIGTERGARQEKMRRTTLIGTKIQLVAANLASKQAMRVSWKRFSGAYEEYIR